MRARGFMQLMVHRGTGITEMPHASSGTRSKSNKRTAAAYEGHRLRKRNRAGEERSSDSFSANVSNSSGVRRVGAKRVQRLANPVASGVASSSDDEVNLARMCPNLNRSHNIVEDSAAGLKYCAIECVIVSASSKVLWMYYCSLQV